MKLSKSKTVSFIDSSMMDTVQSSSPWRPQLPIPHEINVDAVNSTMDSGTGTKKDPKKWTISGLFRRKKKTGGVESDSSSEEDRKAGFSPQKRKKEKRKRASKLAGAFDHVVITPTTTSAAERIEAINHSDRFLFAENTGSLDRRMRRHKMRSMYTDQHNSSSDDGSHPSSMSKFRSDDSLGNHSGGSANRRSRAARTERYMKRLNRDGVSPNRWQTQPVQMDHAPHYLHNSASLSQMPAYRATPATYENHSQFVERLQVPSPAPPVPPREPTNRRLTTNGHAEPRPISYAFDRQPAVWTMNGRCASDDRLWGQNGLVIPMAQVERPASVQPEQAPRRFIRRHEVNYTPPTVGYRYMTDATPRSRKPIQIADAEPVEPVLSPTRVNVRANPMPGRVLGAQSAVKSATQFWRKLEAENMPRGRINPDVLTRSGAKQRSVSSSRAIELMNQRNEELDRKLDEVLGRDEVDNGRLYQRQLDNPYIKYHIPAENKFNSLPHKNHRLRALSPPRVSPLPGFNAKVYTASVVNLKAPVQSPESAPPLPERRPVVSRFDKNRKSDNLEEAIHELEAIYKSLKLSDEELLERATRRDLPTPTSFEKYAQNYKDDEEDDSPPNEPDIVKDDLLYRNIRHANSILKVPETQPPFGIPLGPIPPPPGSDYLNVPAVKTNKPRFMPQRAPDLITDDLAVRNLRKDTDVPKRPQKYEYQNGSRNAERKRAAKSMNESMYAMLQSEIQREAAKPSGGSLDDYLALEMNQLRRHLSDNDEPPNRGPSVTKPRIPQVPAKGAIFNLPSTLKSSPSISPPPPTKELKGRRPPKPTPRKSLSPDTMTQEEKKQLEVILTAIECEAKQKSEKLGQDLIELRKESKSMSSSASPENKPSKRTVEKPPRKSESPKSSLKPRIVGEILRTTPNLNEEFSEVSKAAKKAEELLIGAVTTKKKNRIDKEKLKQDLKATVEAAKVCEKIIDTIDKSPSPEKISSVTESLSNLPPKSPAKKVDVPAKRGESPARKVEVKKSSEEPMKASPPKIIEKVTSPKTVETAPKPIVPMVVKALSKLPVDEVDTPINKPLRRNSTPKIDELKANFEPKLSDKPSSFVKVKKDQSPEKKVLVKIPSLELKADEKSRCLVIVRKDPVKTVPESKPEEKPQGFVRVKRKSDSSPDKKATEKPRIDSSPEKKLSSFVKVEPKPLTSPKKEEKTTSKPLKERESLEKSPITEQQAEVPKEEPALTASLRKDSHEYEEARLMLRRVSEQTAKEPPALPPRTRPPLAKPEEDEDEKPAFQKASSDDYDNLHPDRMPLPVHDASPEYENLDTPTPDREIDIRSPQIMADVSSPMSRQSTAVVSPKLVLTVQHSREEEIDTIMRECELFTEAEKKIKALAASRRSSSLDLSDHKTPYSTPVEDDHSASTAGQPLSFKSVSATSIDNGAVTLPPALPHDDESLYNSSEELAAIFGGAGAGGGGSGSNEAGKSIGVLCRNNKKHGVVSADATNPVVVVATPDVVPRTASSSAFSLDTILESHEDDEAEEEETEPGEREEIARPAATPDSATGDSGNVSLSDFCYEYDLGTQRVEAVKVSAMEQSATERTTREKEINNNSVESNNNDVARRRTATVRPSPPTSSCSSSPSGSSKSLIDSARSRLLQPQHLVLACTYGMANQDMLTLLAIIIAIITLFAVLML